MNISMEIVSTALSIFLIIFLTTQVYAVNVVNDLKLVQLIFRHGDRAPLHTYKNDPYNQSIWVNGMGRLTKIGMEQQFQAGRFYRQRYSKFLDSTNGPNEVYIRSSDQDRTLQSAAAFSAGLFPPSPDTEWNEELGKVWRPVSIHTVPWEEEDLLARQAACPAYVRFHNESFDLPVARHLYKQFRGVFDLVKNCSGAVSSIDRQSAWTALTAVRDVVFCQLSNGFALPTWLNQSTYGKIDYLTNQMFHIISGGDGDKARARLAGGNLLDLILKRMLNKVHQTGPADENATKTFIYSAHDSTVAGLLSTLELYDYNETVFMGIPKYTSAVLVELFMNDTVRISLKNDPTAIATLEPQVLRHPRCDVFCRLEALVKETKDFVVEDWHKECNSGQFGDGMDVDDVTIALITIVLVIILTTIALGCHRRRRSQKKAGSLLREAPSRTDGASSVNYARLDQDEQSL